MKNRSFLTLSMMAAFLFSCSDNIHVGVNTPAVTNMVDAAAIDTSIDPCNDFYAYSCGNWIKNTEIPAGYSSWTRSFNGINAENQKSLNQLLEKFAAETTLTGNQKKLGDYYATCMDEASAEKTALTLLPALLGKIQALSTKEALYQYLATLHLEGTSGFFNFYADQDYGDATQVIGVIDRPSLGLPDRDYYVSQTPKKVELRAKYVIHVAKMLALSGLETNVAESQAATILAMETELAQSMLTLEERRDPTNIYHLMDKAQLTALTPSFSWNEYFTAIGTPSVQTLNVAEPKYQKALATLLTNTSLEDLKNFLRWNLLRANANTLSKAFVDESFNFYGKTLQGKKSQQDRWKTCVKATDALGEALGESYVGTNFSKESKEASQELLQNLRLAVAENFKSIDWMDKATKTKALEKLNKISPKIGYPDKWKDYSSLVVDRSSYLENSIRADVFESKRILAKIGKPVDKTEWGMFPHTVNAYYNPTMNEIVFPAAILQAPFFNVKGSLGANYGAIGMVMGHEITHGFDDEGRNFDGDGNLKDWWSPTVAEKFEGKADCLVKQYNAYTVAGGVHLNGKLTLGENIADLGGLKLSWAAYQNAKEGKPEAPAIAGLNEDQQFFVSNAQVWCAKQTPEYEQLQAQTDPHSTPKYRVNGVVVNIPAFQKAFNCSNGAAMAPENRCSIW